MKKHWFLIIFIVLIALGAYLRLSRLSEFLTFLGDQGRDAIIMKRIITLEDFPGIGPRSSVGQIFLGPFFYYLMAPFLLLTWFNPVGPAIGVAIVSLLGMGFIAWRMHREESSWAALIFLFLTGTSYTMVWLNRFAWNPNLLPLFSFLALYFAFQTARKPTILNGVLFGFFLGGAVQMHYLMLLLFPNLAILIYYGLRKNWDNKALLFKTIFAAAGTFFITLAPMMIFELKNNFLNSRGFIGLFFDQTGDKLAPPYAERLLGVLNNFLLNVFQVTVYGYWGYLFLLTLLIIFLIVFKSNIRNKSFILLHFSVIITFLILFGLVNSERNPHYYTPIYLSFFYLLATFISLIPNLYSRYAIAIVICALFFIPNSKSYWFLSPKPGNFQAKIAEKIADSIISLDIQKPFHIVSEPLSNTNDHIRYYLELKDMRPLPEASLDRAENLVILCYETGPDACNVMNDGQIQVVLFGDKRIAKEIKHPEGVRIFKLVHAK